MDTSKKKRGRPFGSTADSVADSVLPPIRVKKEQLEAYKTKASNQNKTLSAWVKDTLDKEINK